jgi:hypothetical protein
MMTSFKVVLALVTLMSPVTSLASLRAGVRYTSQYLEAQDVKSFLQSQKATTSVLYKGGPVVSNAKILAVYWGQGHDPQVLAGMAPFYKTILASNYFDWFTEYNTPTQKIGRGSFAGSFSIQPGTVSTTVTDSQIQSELNNQITKGTLPAPSTNTVYMVNFPQGVTVDMDGAKSCQDFCAYHNSFNTSSNKLVYYGVLPDSSNPTCITGCGPGTTNLQVTTTGAAHEVAEILTDPDVNNSGIAHYGWQLSDGSEIGDPQACFGSVQNIGAADGTQYQVQSIWSGVRNKCVFGP